MEENYNQPPLQPQTSTPTPAPAPKHKLNKANIVMAILLILALAAAITFGVLWATKKTDAPATNNNTPTAETTTGEATESYAKGPTTNETTAEAQFATANPIENAYFMSEWLTGHKGQRFKLIVSGDGQVFDHLPEEDAYYVLDMQKLGTADAIQKIDLVSLLKPFTDAVIADQLPQTSKNASGQITERSTCGSFTVSYSDPITDNTILISNGVESFLHLEKDIPIKVSFMCHAGDYQVKFYETVYALDMETGTARNIGFSESDFSTSL